MPWLVAQFVQFFIRSTKTAVSFTEALSQSYARIMVVHTHSCCSWASSGKSQHHNQCNQIVRAASMFVFSALSSRLCSFTHLLQSHFTILLFGLLLLAFLLLLSICFTLLRDSCMLIHWITQLTYFFVYFLLVLILGREPAPNCAFNECCCSIAGNHLLQLQEQHIHKSNKLPTNLTNN
jgi:hypothetical protein